MPDILIRFQPRLEFLGRFSYKPLISNFMKIRPVGATLIKEDRRTDVTMLVGAFYDLWERA